MKRYDLRVVCQLFYPELVSTGQTLTELVEELSNSGLNIKVIASQPTILKNSKKVSKSIDYKGITVIRTWSTRFSKLSFIGKLTNLSTFFITASFNVLLFDRRVPLLLLTNPPYLSLLGRISKFFYRTKYGVLLFDIMPEQAELVNVIKKGGILSAIWRYLNKLWYIKASYAVVLSKDMLEGAITNANLTGTKHEKQCRDKTQIIHVWSDDRLIQPIPKLKSIYTEKLGVKDKLVVQYSGNHGRFHDIETVIDAAKKLKDKANIVFQFIGEGYKKKLVDSEKGKYGLNNVYSSTYVPKETLSDSLAMADLGVVAQMPGQERVCYPSKLLGVFSSGRPVLAVCSKNSEMAHMITEHDLGFVVENGDVNGVINVLNFCLENPGNISEKGKKAYKYLNENLSLKLASQKYFKVISNNL